MMRVVALVLIVAPSALAAAATPVGLWRTIDDKTGKDRSLIRITERNGTYEGTVERILTNLPDDDPNHLCRRCTGDRKDKPIVGMTILWGLKHDGDATYDGGEILDPKNGKTYSAKATLDDDGKTLDVRGYIGVSLLGRSQKWHRQE
jgi:uncharacterized protein (DUF2147 family)